MASANLVGETMNKETTTTTMSPSDTSAVDSMKVEELKAALKSRKLKTGGNKKELVQRLKVALMLDDEKEVHDDDDDDDNDADRTVINKTLDEDADDDDDDDYYHDEDDDDHDERSQRTNRSRRRTKYVPTFKDVEESMKTFSGDATISATRWLTEFEETANLCEWTEVQKIIYAKRLLRGSAKIFVNYEKCTKTWKQFKKALKEEFAHKVDSHMVHRELCRKKKRPEESYHDYIYGMIEVASQANIEMCAVFKYIIDGINDDEATKAVLYGAKSVRELKAKFDIYEEMKSNAKPKQKYADIPKKTVSHAAAEARPTAAAQRCFNCGRKDHVKTNCPSISKGTKCFQCNEFGHISAKCPKNVKKSDCNVTNSKELQQKLEKTVSIDGKQQIALIDSGSDISLISSECYVRIGAPKLEECTIQFRGIGCDTITTLGQVHLDVEIDGNLFDIIFHVVSDKLIRRDLLIGADFLKTVNVQINRGNVTIFKINHSDVPDVFKVDVIADENALDLSHLKNIEQKTEIESIVKDYRPIKSKEANVRMRIILTDEAPVCQRPRRLSPSEKEDVDVQINAWLKEGIIRPSVSDFASPIVLVKKKDGSTRICVDYRKLNEKIIKDRYPLPLIEDHLDRLQSAKIFSTIDLKNGFFHTLIEESSIKYTAFVIPNAQYEFLRVPFGLCNSPSVFQRFINDIFRDLIAAGTLLVYIDDLIIPSINYAEGLKDLKTVLQRASEYGLNINWKKCAFLQNSVDYLGYIVEDGHIRPTTKKISAVKEFPRPTCVKGVQSFLGLTGYFRKFICRYAEIAKPLTSLLRTNTQFEFGSKEQHAFDKLKLALTSEPILMLYNPKAETELHTDASTIGYGAILLQRNSERGYMQPVYYASGTTTPAESRYCSYELEVLAIVRALKKFRIYLLGIQFKIITDCKAFVCTMKKKDLSVRIARWALFLEEFSYTVEHRSGNRMSHVDALSRYPLPSVYLVEEDYDGVLEKFRLAQKRDDEITKLSESVKQAGSKEYAIRNDVLYKQKDGEVFIVVPKPMQEGIIRQAHERGHFSADKTEKMIQRDYWFPKMRNKVETIIRNCISCILAERKQGKGEGYLHPIDKGDLPLDVFHVDHIGPLPSTSKRYKHIFLIVDAFSKFVWLYPVKSTDTREVLDRLQKQSTVFGNPRRIITDRGSAFTAQAFKEYCDDEGIEHVTITTGMPRSNGQVERMNRILIPILTKLAAPKPENWYKYVDVAQKYINSTFSRSIKFSPFNILFGTRMRLKDDPQLKEIIEQESVIIFQKERDHLREQAKDSIHKIQAENKRSFDRKRKRANRYKAGTLVAIKRTQYGPGQKLCGKFLGPYRVSKILRNDRYLVEKIGEHPGPYNTSTSAEYMKPWPNGTDVLSDNESE